MTLLCFANLSVHAQLFTGPLSVPRGLRPGVRTLLTSYFPWVIGSFFFFQAEDGIFFSHGCRHPGSSSVSWAPTSVLEARARTAQRARRSARAPLSAGPYTHLTRPTIYTADAAVVAVCVKNRGRRNISKNTSRYHQIDTLIDRSPTLAAPPTLRKRYIRPDSPHNLLR